MCIVSNFQAPVVGSWTEASAKYQITVKLLWGLEEKSKKQWNRGRFNIILRHVNIWVYWYICICEILKWALATHWWHINQNWPLKLGDGVYAVNAIRLFVLAISTVDAICLTHIANASFAVCSSKVMSNFILISYKFFLEHKPTIAYLKIEWSINLFKYPPSVAYGI